MRMRSRYPSGRDRERGAVIVIVAITMTALIGAAAYAVDAGGAWESQRRLRTSTDAAALAAANEYASGNPDACASIAAPYVEANDPDAELTACEPHGDGTWGYVTVSAESPVDFQFAGIFGIDGTDVGSTTHAMYGIPTGARWLRPMALCVDAHADLNEWLNTPADERTDSEPIEIRFGDSTASCGGAPGNWGVLAFEESQSNADTKEWVLNGYPELVPLSIINGNTGVLSPSLDSELNALQGTEFALPLFDQVTGQGSNAEFRIVAFVWVELIDYKISGSQGDRSLTLRFLAGRVLEGTCCGTGGPDTGVRAVRICGTDADATEGCVAEDGG